MTWKLQGFFVSTIALISSPAVSFAQAAAPAQPGLLDSLIPLVLIFAVFYFFVIRPQGKKQKEHLKVLENLKEGDEVITSGGIIGKIKGLSEKLITLEVSQGVQIKILRGQIAALAKEGLK